MKASLQTVAAMIPAGASLEEELRFYVESLGFTVTWRSGSMAGVQRDGVAFNLIENDNRIWAENASFSIGVSDLDELYGEYRDIPARVGSLEMKAWGRREFHLITPAGVCFQFYQRG